MMYGATKRIWNYCNIDIVDLDFLDSSNGFPILYREMNVDCYRLISFNHALSFRECKDGVGVHFYIDDYQFERVWNFPHKYINILKSFSVVFSPDFSMFRGMPQAMLIWNHYRSQALAQYWQNHGIRVIPSLNWADETSYQFSFSGVPAEGTVSVSTVGAMHCASSYRYWQAGMAEAVQRLRPKRILAYGEPVEFDAGGAEVVWFQSEHLKRMRTYNHKKGCTKHLGKGAQSPRARFLVSHPGVVYEVAKRLQIPRNDWEDFYQEVILRCLQTSDHYDPHRGSLIGWSRCFAELVALNFRKQNKSKFLNFDDSCASSSFE